MNELVFTTFTEWFIPGHAFIDYEEIAQGLRRIHFVENFDVLREQFKHCGLAPWIPNYEKYKTYDEYVEDTIERAIDHEMLHCVLFDIGGEKTSIALHNVDRWGGTFSWL